LVMKVFFINFPWHSLFHGCKNILQASLIKFILLFVLKLIEYWSQIVDTTLRDFNIFAILKDLIGY
jgi:hypothetical protein